MKIIDLTCTKCGSNLSVNYEDGMKYAFCQYCGQKMILDDGSIDIRVHHDGKIINENYNYNENHNITEDKTKTDIAYLIASIFMVIFGLLFLYFM